MGAKEVVEQIAGVLRQDDELTRATEGRIFTDTVDLRELFKKYIAHVRSCEGVDFIEFGHAFSEVKFSPEEREELERLGRESEEVPDPAVRPRLEVGFRGG